MQTNYTQLIDQQMRVVEEISAASDWAKVESSGPSTLYSRKYNKNPVDLNKIETVFPYNIELVKKFFDQDVTAQHALRENSDYISVIEEIDANTKVVQNKGKGAFLISSRDFLCVQQIRPTPQGGYIIVKANLESHPKQVVTKDTVRGELVISSLVLTPLDAQRTQGTSYFLIDPKGSIPNSAVNSAKSKQLKYLEKVIEHIKKNY